jgi:hypothetical protein
MNRLELRFPTINKIATTDDLAVYPTKEFLKEVIDLYRFTQDLMSDQDKLMQLQTQSNDVLGAMLKDLKSIAARMQSKPPSADTDTLYDAGAKHV